MPSAPLEGACVVLVRTQGPINLGMVARLCGNFGIDDLRLVAPECEVNCEDSRKFSTHNREQLLHAPIHPTLEAATADCGLVIGSSARLREGELGPGLEPASVPQLLRRRPARRWALVFGNEADGLNDAEIRCCQAWVHLSTFGPNTSYNLANAVAIILYGIASAVAPRPIEEVPAAERGHVEDLYRYWQGTLERFLFFRRANAERFAPQLRKFIGRMHLTTHDVQVLRGMLAQFNYFTFGDRFTQPGSGSIAEEAEAGEAEVDGTPAPGPDAGT
jgi:tRNA/rRNA methyltransferase